ncbi:MAG: hypothetical protein Q7T11_04920 [Deltaproteobacteria bacterium]|nr:hypothetical protein [Deltaproteobacteria bacterium]
MGSLTYLAVGPSTAATIDSYDDGNLSSGVFKQTEMKISQGDKEQFLFSIDQGAQNFLAFKAGFWATFASFRNVPAARDNPDYAPILGTLGRLEAPETFSVILRAGLQTTEKLKSIFQGHIREDGFYPEKDGKPINRLVVSFPSSGLSAGELQSLGLFLDLLGQNRAPTEMAQTLGLEYLNLYLFAQNALQAPQTDAVIPVPTGVTPLDPDESRAGYCTEEGFVPEEHGKIGIGSDLSLNLEIGDKRITNKPILRHHVAGRGSDDILMPFRDIKFKINTDEPVEPRQFDEAIAQITTDIVSITSGTFSRVCGLRRLKDFGGRLIVYVLGKADPIGAPDRNLELSQLRARKVAEAVSAQLELRTNDLKTKDGISVVYAGAGEELSSQGPDAENPAERATEIRIMSQGEPRFEAHPDFRPQWAHATGYIPPSPEMQGISIADECTGQPTGCEEALKEIVDTVPLLCQEATPFDDETAAACAQRMTQFAWGVNDGSHGGLLRYWMERRSFLGFPRFDGQGWTYSLEDAFTEARQYLKAGGTYQPRSLTSASVVNPQMTMKDLGSHDISVCSTEGEFEANSVFLNEEPRGITYRRKGDQTVIGREGTDPIAVEVDADVGTTVKSILPWHVFRFQNGRLINRDEVFKAMANTFNQAVNSDGFYGDCIPFFFVRTFGVGKFKVYLGGNLTREEQGQLEGPLQDFFSRVQAPFEIIGRLDSMITGGPAQPVAPGQDYLAVLIEPDYRALFYSHEKEDDPTFFNYEPASGSSRDNPAREPVPVLTPK